jgi:hypothetical protein
MSISALQEQPFSPEAQSFDYNALDPEVKIVVQQRTSEIKEKLRDAAKTAWEIGQKLADVRDRLEYGVFDSWLKAEFEWSRRTAYNYIKIFETFGSCATVAQLGIAAKTLYLLAAPSTPSDARSEALERAALGEAITHNEAKAIVSRHKESATRSAPSANVDAFAETMERQSSAALAPNQPETEVKTEQLLGVPENFDSSGSIAQVKEVKPVLSECNGRREWVRICTERPQVSQWNSRTGVVVARPRGSVYVQIGNHTPSFLESEVQLIDIKSFPDDSQEPGLPHAPGKQEQLLGKESEKEPCQKNNLEADSSTSPKSKDFLETEDEFLANRTPLDASDSPDFTNQISAEQLNVGYTSTKEELHSTEQSDLSTALNSWGELGSSAISNLVIKEVKSDRSATEVKSDRSPLAEAGASKTELSPRSLVPEPKSQDKQLLPDVERNGDTPKDAVPPMPAVVINRAALAQGMPEVVVTELAIALLGLAPDQLARLLIFVSNGLGKSQINAVIETWSCTELERISTELKHITVQVDRESSRRNCSCAEKLEEKVQAPAELEVEL